MNDPANFNLIPEKAMEWINAGNKTALATVIKTWGSAPRPVGAQLAVCENGDIAGSVSGGCVEAAVVIAAHDAMQDGQVRILEYGVNDETAFAVGLACGGRISIMVEPAGMEQGFDIALLAKLTKARAERRPVAWVVNTKTWERRLSSGVNDPLASEITARMNSDKSGFHGDWFIAIHNPPLKLMIIGAVHIAQHLIPMANSAGYDPVLIDPRQSFATDTRFPGVAICQDWPNEALQTLGLDRRTAVVTLSHDPKIDDPAILETLQSDAFYLGCLGSRKTHAKRVERLKLAGLTDTDIARIHAPVGLNIGAKSPAEIALSVIAEMTACLRGFD